MRRSGDKGKGANIAMRFAAGQDTSAVPAIAQTRTKLDTEQPVLVRTGNALVIIGRSMGGLSLRRASVIRPGLSIHEVHTDYCHAGAC